MCVAYTHTVYRNKEKFFYPYKHIQESTVSDIQSFLRLLWVQDPWRPLPGMAAGEGPDAKPAGPSGRWPPGF